jgi:hypothetical protein
MEAIDAFKDDCMKILGDWKISNDAILDKTKILKENLMSIEVLEKNLRGTCEHINCIKQLFVKDEIDLSKDVLVLNELSSKISQFDVDCKLMLKKLLDLHHVLQKETNIAQFPEVNNDPFGVMAANVVWSGMSTPDFRFDPPINDICQSEFKFREFRR